jgi:hypothetical protein
MDTSVSELESLRRASASVAVWTSQRKSDMLSELYDIGGLPR